MPTHTMSEQAWALLMGDRTIPRQTQDSPIRPSVWAAYLNGEHRVALLLAPLREVTAGRLHNAFQENADCPPRIYNQSTVATRMTFHEMLIFALPKSKWWSEIGHKEMARCGKEIRRKKAANGWRKLVNEMVSSNHQVPLRSSFFYFLLAVGIVELQRDASEGDSSTDLAEVADGSAKGGDRIADFMADRIAAGYELIRACIDLRRRPTPLLFAISVNRKASIASLESARTIKADAARQLFSLDFSDIRWAVLDTGIDVAHPAFENVDADLAGKKKKKAGSKKKKTSRKPGAIKTGHRIVETYDFTRLEEIMNLATSPDFNDRKRLATEFGVDVNLAERLHADLQEGRDIDWDQFAKVLRVEDPKHWDPLHPHGTHVAGVLGAGPYPADDESKRPEDRQGLCPNIRIVDMRVLDENGMGDEFAIIAALQFIRHRNANKEKPIIQGVNMSLQLLHDVRNYACGQTPICEEVDRLAGAGIVAVAAAGNLGFGETGAQVAKEGGGYLDISIMDPGNAETAITVGSTHSEKPHRYGVSFFSGRGPTGDGRLKPDIVAPGEKVVGPVPGGGSETMDGTSQAAPHVSAAAAMLMARNKELIGQPQRIKEILCDNATDLGREQYFQGKGLVDVLRAMQAI